MMCNYMAGRAKILEIVHIIEVVNHSPNGIFMMKMPTLDRHGALVALKVGVLTNDIVNGLWGSYELLRSLATYAKSLSNCLVSEPLEPKFLGRPALL
jgi:hypothetical protein